MSCLFFPSSMVKVNPTSFGENGFRGNVNRIKLTKTKRATRESYTKILRALS